MIPRAHSPVRARIVGLGLLVVILVGLGNVASAGHAAARAKGCAPTVATCRRLNAVRGLPDVVVRDIAVVNAGDPYHPDLYLRYTIANVGLRATPTLGFRVVVYHSGPSLPNGAEAAFPFGGVGALGPGATAVLDQSVR